MGLFTKDESKSGSGFEIGAHQWRGVIDEYRNRLPVSSKTPVVTLGEGGTPLVAAAVLSEMLGNEIWL